MKKSILILVALLIPAALYAVDGQTLINQSTVMAAGGFPYVISQPGSYKLSSNLSVPNHINGIHIEASNVTLDLNGFSITTPTQPQVPASFGIQTSTGLSGMTIRNGSVRGFTAPLAIGGSSTLLALEDLFLEWGFPGGSSGFGVGTFARVIRVNATDQDLSYGCPSVITLNSVRSVNRDFFAPGPGTCSVTDNAVLF
jgi:hypothetical protein